MRHATVVADFNDLNSKDFLVDLQTYYITYFPADLGFAVSYLPRDFESDDLSPDDFIAQPVHFAAWGAIPNDEELSRLSRIAAYLFAIRFLARLERRAARDRQPQLINEDSAHDLDTNIHVV